MYLSSGGSREGGWQGETSHVCTPREAGRCTPLWPLFLPAARLPATWGTPGAFLPPLYTCWRDLDTLDAVWKSWWPENHLLVYICLHSRRPSITSADTWVARCPVPHCFLFPSILHTHAEVWWVFSLPCVSCVAVHVFATRVGLLCLVCCICVVSSVRWILSLLFFWSCFIFVF